MRRRQAPAAAARLAYASYGLTQVEDHRSVGLLDAADAETHHSGPSSRRARGSDQCCEVDAKISRRFKAQKSYCFREYRACRLERPPS
ncbi:hypothetical protein MQE23_00465 [Streptomyces sp. HP-A2021]|uniref:hypothetical protein n=1 Tax=Streptomyces sp. HP-A2021 TaxID=2927875 RepID=UPI001FAE9622|nr:hypothetical protein [Streptomyces sp. HP-A2021]UOB07652.1 hypothetical protein MQE23_00465 [Streptomyces sp. HP-A2021]